MTAAPSIDGPSRPLVVELLLTLGVYLVIAVVIGVATLGAIGMAALLYFILAFLPGLVVWIPLLVIVRRYTRTRPVPQRIVGSVIAALAAIAVNLAVVMLLIAPLGGYWGLYVAFAFVDSLVFIVAVLVAAFVVHLGAARRSR